MLSKSLLSVCLIFIGLVHSLAGNIFIEFSEPIRENTKLTIIASVTKTGGKSEVYNVYGTDLHYYDQEKIQIYATYLYIPLGNKVKLAPSDIRIDRGGEIIQMPQPVYQMDSAKRVSEKWIITFNDIPGETSNLIIKAAGIQKIIGDLERAEIARNQKLMSTIKDKEIKVFDYAEINPPDHLRLKNRIDSMMQVYVSRNPGKFVKGTIEFKVDQQNKTTVVVTMNDSASGSFHQLIKPLLSKEKLDSRKMGYMVRSRDIFNIIIASGDNKAVVNSSSAVFTPDITDDEVRAYLTKSLINKGTYNVRYQYAAINGNQVYNLTTLEETKKIGKAGKSIIGLSIVLTLVIIIMGVI